MKWLPREVGSLFFRSKGMYGIFYWFDLVNSNK